MVGQPAVLSDAERFETGNGGRRLKLSADSAIARKRTIAPAGKGRFLRFRLHLTHAREAILWPKRPLWDSCSQRSHPGLDVDAVTASGPTCSRIKKVRLFADTPDSLHKVVLSRQSMQNPFSDQLEMRRRAAEDPCQFVNTQCVESDL
jgi:hypothetical protein